MQPNPGQETLAKVERMSPQMKLLVIQDFLAINRIEQAKAALPIFGGTNPEGGNPSGATGEPSSNSEKKDETNPAGGSSTSTQEPGAMTPAQISELLEKVSTLTTEVTDLTTKNQTYESEKEAADRAKLSREEAMQKDLEKSQQTVAQMDGVIKYLAIINAIQNNDSGIEFHDPTQVLRELDEGGFELNVDLEKSTASVKGIEKELSRIAQEKSWMVKAGSQQQQEQKPQQRPASGRPPSNPSNQSSAKQQRTALEEKWPVIAAGRAKMPKLTR